MQKSCTGLIKKKFYRLNRNHKAKRFIVSVLTSNFQMFLFLFPSKATFDREEPVKNLQNETVDTQLTNHAFPKFPTLTRHWKFSDPLSPCSEIFARFKSQSFRRLY